jgi:hypothetical protein
MDEERFAVEVSRGGSYRVIDRATLNLDTRGPRRGLPRIVAWRPVESRAVNLAVRLNREEAQRKEGWTMEMTVKDLQTAYNRAAWSLDKALVKLAILQQNETTVEDSTYAECAAKAQALREVLDQVDRWLAEHREGQA